MHILVQSSHVLYACWSGIHESENLSLTHLHEWIYTQSKAMIRCSSKSIDNNYQEIVQWYTLHTCSAFVRLDVYHDPNPFYIIFRDLTHVRLTHVQWPESVRAIWLHWMHTCNIARMISHVRTTYRWWDAWNGQGRLIETIENEESVMYTVLAQKYCTQFLFVSSACIISESSRLSIFDRDDADI